MDSREQNPIRILLCVTKFLMYLEFMKQKWALDWKCDGKPVLTVLDLEFVDRVIIRPELDDMKLKEKK